jgi:diguanylate cyclase (GGDEF)-like protein
MSGPIIPGCAGTAPTRPACFRPRGDETADRGCIMRETCHREGDALPAPAAPLSAPRHTLPGRLAALLRRLIPRRGAAAPPLRALQDPLTGLPSHDGFRERLEAALSLGRRRGWRTAVLVLNLRRFRELNEAHGRGAGDLALRLVAARLRGALRREDVVARLAGDRFAVAQTALDHPAGALRLAERLSAVLAEPLPLERGAASVAADIGIAIGPSDGEEAGELITRAEDALALARTAPMPAIHCFAAEQQASLRLRRQLERDLRDAVAEGAFTLHWQPQRRLRDRSLVGFEALLRWPHPTRGLIPPDAFIPLAEATGLIVPLGRWVMLAAAAEAARWPAGIKAAVNLSAVQVAGEGLPDLVAEALASAGLPACRLELEVTESVLMQDADHAARVLDALQAQGAAIALDDFGTGWSSLAYLRRFRFDHLKMDRSFLSGLESDPRTEPVVAAVLALGRGLGIGVIAEGIETEAQAARLATMGCETGQGWLLGRPMPADQARALIARELAAQRAA